MENNGNKLARINRICIRNQKRAKYSCNSKENVDHKNDRGNDIENEEINPPLRDITNGQFQTVPQSRQKRCSLSAGVNEMRKQKNLMSSSTSFNTPECQGPFLNKPDKGEFCRTKIFGFHTPESGKTNAHVLDTTPLYQNCTPPISIPIMSCGQVASSQPLAHDPKSLPLRDLRNAFENYLYGSTKQKKNKNTLVKEIPDLSCFNMQYGNSSFNSATSEDDSSCFGGDVLADLSVDLGDKGIQDHFPNMKTHHLPDLNVPPIVQDSGHSELDTRGKGFASY